MQVRLGVNELQELWKTLLHVTRELRLVQIKWVVNQLPMKGLPTLRSTCLEWLPMDTQSIFFLIPSENFKFTETGCLVKPTNPNTIALIAEKSLKPSTLSRSIWECLNTPVTDHLPVQHVGKAFDCPARCVDTRSSTPTSDPLNVRFVRKHSIDTLRWRHITKLTRIWFRMKAWLLCDVVFRQSGMELLTHFTVNLTQSFALQCTPSWRQGTLGRNCKMRKRLFCK